jgi:hypothetical protein
MDTLEALDSRIRALEMEIIYLREQRNTRFALVCRLPPELMTEVLKTAQYADYFARSSQVHALDRIFPGIPNDVFDHSGRS